MRYQDANIEMLTKDITDAANQSGRENKGMMIYGPTGTGKTYAMHALAKAKKTITKIYSVKNYVDLLSEFRDYIKQGWYFEKMKEICDEDLLFIDDLGAEKTTDFSQEFLYAILNRRYENMHRTFITSNLTLKEMNDRYGSRIVSRIAEMCVLVELQGQDKRI